MGNNLVKSFLQDTNHQKLYSNYLEKPTEANKELIGVLPHTHQPKHINTPNMKKTLCFL